MDVQKEVVTQEIIGRTEECHCSVCFKKINDVDAATYSQAGRYYCRNCRAMFGEKSLANFIKRAV